MNARRSPFLPYWVWILRPPAPNTGPLPRVERVPDEALLKLAYVRTTKAVPLSHEEARWKISKPKVRPVSLLPMFRGRPEGGFLRYDGEGRLMPSRALLLDTGVEAPEAREVRAGAFTGLYIPPPGPYRSGKPGKTRFLTTLRWNVRTDNVVSAAAGWRAVIYLTPPLVLVHEDRDPREWVWAIPGLAQQYGMVYKGSFRALPWFMGNGRPIYDEWGAEPFRSIHVTSLPPRDLVKLDELMERGAI